MVEIMIKTIGPKGFSIVAKDPTNFVCWVSNLNAHFSIVTAISVGTHSLFASRMDYGTYCSNRETFGISINKDLLTSLNTTNCIHVNGNNSSELISLTLRIFIGISWLGIVLIGTIANISVLFVIGFVKPMRTIQNWLLFNLAVADCLMTLVAFPLLGIFQAFYYPVWQLPHEFCYVLNCFTHIGALASGASLAAISIYRFIMIRYVPKYLY